MNEALQKLEVKVENEGATPQGRLSSAEWNVVVSALKAIDAGDGGLGKDAILKAVREAGYVTRSDVNTIFSEDAVRVSVAQNIAAQHNFVNGIKINNLAISQSQGDTIYIDANVVVRGGITARGTNTTQSPSLFDALPIDSRTIKRDANGMLYVDAEALNVSGGLDEEQLEVYLTTNQYAKKSDIPSISNITYASVVAALGYTPYSTAGGMINGDIQAMKGRFVMQKNGDHSSIIPEVTALTVSTNSAGYNGYHTGIGFNALGDYGSLTYQNHIHAWIGLGAATTTAEAECYPLVLATNGNTSTGASPVERMRINPDGQVIVTGDTLLGSINLQYSDEINRYGGNLYLQHRNGDGTGHVVMCYNGGNVGIGVAYPSEKLQVLGNIALTEGVSNPYISIKDNTGAMWYVQYASNCLRFGLGTAKSLSVDRSGNVCAIGGITAHYTSDERLKTNLRPINAGKMILSLGRVREFEYIDSEIEKNSLYKGRHIGLIYQDVKGSALPKMCFEREDGYGSLNYFDTSLKALLVGVAQEHEIRLTKDERELQAVKEENKALRKEIEYLKQRVV